MASKLANINAATTEGGANTYANGKHEIPGSSGAKAVFLMNGTLDVQEPDLEDAVNRCYGTVWAGDFTARTSVGVLSDNGCMMRVMEILNSDATDILFAVSNSPAKVTSPWEIPKAADGKYYITLEILGQGNANAKSVRFAGSFRIET
jgi:hypothetical protein